MMNAFFRFPKISREFLVVLIGLSFSAVASDVAYSYIEVSGNISSNTTWGPNQTYYVTGNIAVAAGATLTIEEGTVVKITTIKPRKKIIVSGTIDVNGVDGNEVIFTSMDDDSYGEIIQGSDGIPEPGDWQKIQVDGTGQFDWCSIRYGGAGKRNPSVLFNGSDPSSFFTNSISEYSAYSGMEVRNSSPTITGSTFANNASDGLYVSGGAAAPTITDNTFTNNGGYGALLDNLSLTTYSGNTGSGNGINGFGVSGTVSADATWSSGSSDFPFVMAGNVTVDAGATLALSAGTTIKAAGSSQLTVNGALDVNGTSGEPVVFTSLQDDGYGGDTNGDGGATSPAPGDWYGIHLSGGAGQFDWSIIRYGGNASGSADANVYFDQSSSGNFTDSISEYSANYGVQIRDSSPTFRNSTIAHNSNYGVYVTGSTANPDFGTTADPGNNTFQDNSIYHLYNDTSNTITAIGNTWIPPGSTYGPTMVVFSSFNAMPGDGKVTLMWRTESEMNNAGFAIYKSEVEDGDYTRITFVPGAEDSEISKDYKFTDDQVESGHTYYYYLEGISLSGKRTKTDVIQASLAEASRPRKPKLLSNVERFPTQTQPTLPIQIEQDMLPRHTSLFANYPNPSNPETWIPYNLAKATDVTIQIYDARGHLVRTLYLGHQLAGFYVGKDKAAYWDGRDHTGERVGSGVYFYCLSAGSFSAMRKMVILK
jgi:parallel beta-helix repeat protein